MSASASPPSSSADAAAITASPAASRKRPRDDAGGDEEDEKRVPPATRTAAASCSVYLHRHVLESIFACLDIAGLATAMAVSRDWQAAVGSMRVIGHRLATYPEQLVSIYKSRMRHHVTSLNVFCSYGSNPDVLSQLHLHLPCLQELVCVSSLATVAQTNLLFRSIGQLSQLRRLEIEPGSWSAEESFAPLALLSQLRFFKMLGPSPLSDAHIDTLRALTDVEEVWLTMDAADTARLLRPPHTLRWHYAPYMRGLSDDVCALLPSLRCLTKLFFYREPCVNFDWLPRMESLTELHIELGREHPDRHAAASSLADALQHCSRITSLTLAMHHLPMTAEQLTAGLAGMTALATLDISYARLSSLSFLSVPSLAASLCKLSLHDLRGLNPASDEFNHLYTLVSLCELSLQGTFAFWLDGKDNQLELQAYMPNLRKVEVCPLNSFAGSDSELDDNADDEDEEQEEWGERMAEEDELDGDAAAAQEDQQEDAAADMPDAGDA